jgi:hypothetical protein
LVARSGTNKCIDAPTVEVGDKSAALSASLTATELMKLVFTHIFLRSASGSGSGSGSGSSSDSSTSGRFSSE